MIPADYYAGRDARNAQQGLSACPHSREAADFGSSAMVREASPMCLRHWWLAGWHDRDLELGYRISEVAA